MTIKKTATILARSFALLALWGCSGENNYTVETRGGVPFIHVDGEPVRGRMFYSNVPGAKYMNIDRNEKPSASTSPPPKTRTTPAYK